MTAVLSILIILVIILISIDRKTEENSSEKDSKINDLYKEDVSSDKPNDNSRNNQ